MLQATSTNVRASNWPSILNEATLLRTALLKRGRRAPTFVVMSRTETSPPWSGAWEDRGDPLQARTSLRELERHEAELDALIRPRGGIVMAPVSSGTEAGIRRGLLRHPSGSAWHFEGPGRYYLAQVLLNSISVYRRGVRTRK